MIAQFVHIVITLDQQVVIDHKPVALIAIDNGHKPNFVFALGC